MKVLFEYRPKLSSKTSNKYADLVLGGIFFIIFFYGTGNLLLSICFPLFIFTLTHLFEAIEKHFNGWKLADNTITLISDNRFRKVRTMDIPYDKISSLRIHKSGGSKDPSYILFITEIGNFKLYSIPFIFDVARTLKYLQDDKNIKVWFDRTSYDHEVDLYLKGFIDKLPMNNTDIIRFDKKT